MSRGILLVMLLLSAPAAMLPAQPSTDFAAHVQQQLGEVGRLWQAGEIPMAVAILERLVAREELVSFGAVRASVLYNLACGYSLLGREAEAIARLEAAVKSGFSDIALIEKDTDLDGIRLMPEFAGLIRQLKASLRRWEGSFLATPFREELGEEEKVAGLSALWSEVKYNFAWFDRVPDLDWDSLYVETLTKVRQTESTLDYYRTLQAMVAHLQDGHTGVNLPPELYDETSFRPPLRTRLVEDRVLVVEVDPKLAQSSDALLRPGFEVVRVDGVPVLDYAAKRILPYVRASTPQARDVWVYDYELLLGPEGTGCELTLSEGRGPAFTVYLSREVPVMVRPDAEPRVRLLEGGIALLTIKSFADNSVVSGFDSLFAALESSEALIIDLRDNGGGNSGVGYTLLGYLADEPFPILRCGCLDYIPVRRARGFKEGWHEEQRTDWPASVTSRYRKQVVVLTSPRTGSAAEDFCAVFRSMGKGAIIGETTAGSTGQPLVFPLPGGGNATVCTLRCTAPDGAAFVGMGLKPDMEVHPSAADVAAGRDAVLEAAWHALRSGDRGDR